MVYEPFEQAKQMPPQAYQFTLPMQLPGLNEYINTCRLNRYQGARMKRMVENKIAFFIMRLPMIKRPVTIHFHWIEPNRKRDLDNVAFAKKFILDALVKRGKLEDDSSKYVTGFTDTFEIGTKAQVIVLIQEERT